MTTTLKTGYNVVLVPSMAQAFQRLYVTNDFDPVQVTDDGLTMRPAGIVAPTVDPVANMAGGGSVEPGDHLVRYRYQDQARGRLSDPSDAVLFTVVAGTQTVTIDVVASADATVDHIIVEMTPVGASTYYRAAIAANANGSPAIPWSDDTLIQQIPSSRDGDFQHLPPPIASIITEHRQRLWLWGAAPRTFTGVTLTNGSTTVSGTGFSDQWAGRQMVGDDGLTYAIASSTVTDITLETAYAGPNTGSGTIVVKSGSPSLLAWSRATFPESFDATAFARNITLDAGDTPAAMASYFSDLYLMGTRSMRRLVFTGDPAAGMLLSVPGTMGAFHDRCVCSAGAGLLFGWGRDGAWKIDAMQPQKISRAIETTLAALADNALVSERFICYEPIQRIALFFFVLQGETACRAAFAYHDDTGEWQLWRYRQPFTAACPNSVYADRQRLMLADANGYSWRVGTHVNDGAGSDVMSVTSATTTVLQGANSAVVGQMAYRPNTGEERLITASSPTQITVPAFGTTPAAGELIYIGSIRERILTGWFSGGGLATKERPQWLQLHVRATRTAGRLMGTAKVRFYRDFDSVNPIGVTSMPNDEWPAGVSIVDGGTVIDVDFDAGGTDGFIPVPLPDAWNRAVCAEIIFEQSYSPVRMLDVLFTADDRYAAAPVKNE